MMEFLDMGGYGQYVWSSYAVSAVAIAGLGFAIWRRGKTLRDKLERLERETADHDAGHESH